MTSTERTCEHCGQVIAYRSNPRGWYHVALDMKRCSMDKPQQAAPAVALRN